ncbi:hypothetical protein [Virgibacillus sp. L01]|uniref:hypothetical protein n=1 Tax=Virgibacillus sp. L01 TaxID=3457429 RepID=UPI003FD30502
MTDKSELYVDKIEVLKNKVSVYYHSTGEIARCLKGNVFWVEYDFNIQEVPESILVIPFLANICPIAWITDSYVYCNEIDTRFSKSIEKIRRSFQSMYPEKEWKGELIPERFINNQEKFEADKSKSALFFSGGVDSLASYIMAKREKPMLITVWGADVETNNDNGWSRVENSIKKFANSVDSETAVIKSNFREFLNYQYLDFFGFVKRNWWQNVQHGLGFIGLAGPLTYDSQISNLYFAASHNFLIQVPYGSHPTIDNNISWGSDVFRVYHHYYVLRYQKVALISDYIKEYNPNLKIRVCFRTKDGRNCSNCLKCTTLIIYMMLAGLVPSNHGFKPIDEQVLNEIRYSLENRGWVNKNTKHRLNIMKELIPKRKDSLPDFSLDFFNWLEKADLNKIEKRNEIKRKWIYLKGKVKTKFSN